ncbi:hypothetical protein B0T17DRAFT_607648 [Bombardia bombarda]|uniref:Protein kinase domain-containing protein n=1 Tax=Bombardia bombarda TaxID=252184 RepID=A0AA39XBH1_9PEZI|nr:hypothetical protein B0T17DRAFT_607648 [Bombardia bombarda]
MDDEIARLRQALAETEQRSRENEKRLRENAERSRENEKRLRENAERLQEKTEQITRPQTLMPYLEACHSLSLAIQVVTRRSMTTQGNPTNPVGRLYPRRIIPWDDFPARQEEIWEQLSEPSFTSQHQFPSQTQMDYVRSLIGSISSEDGLRYFERDTVENAVQKLIGVVNDNILLRDRFGLRGTVTFESHTNLGNTENNLTESLSLSEGGTSDGTPARTGLTYKAQSKIKGKGKGNRADNFCIYETSDGVIVPKIAIEYKAPHKLTQDEISTGLVSEVQPDRDVINKDGKDFAFTSRALAAAVVTQLFSYMIGKGIQYGYVSTGEAFVFLYIPDDASTVYYYVSVPNLDVRDDDETRLHRTAVAQVFAFILQSLRAEPPSQVWHDAAATLDTWAVEYDDILSRIPETVRKGKQPRASPYKAQHWRGFKRSPIRTRSSCRPLDINSGFGDDSDDSDDEDAPPSPTAGRSTRFGKEAASSSSVSSGRRGQGGRGGRQQRGAEQTRGGRQQRGAERTRIQDRPYCTHHCLLGLAYGGPIDESCPNAESHGSRHINLAKFKPLVRTQLAKDRGPDADSVSLYLSGSIGALLKIRLSAFGYTFVAKAVEAPCLKRLQHEEKMYDHLRSIQGEHVPVCLGLINLVLPYYYDGGVFRHLLLLSWGGRPLPYCTNQIDKTRVIAAVSAAFTSLHRLQVLHGDAEARNITYDKGPMIVDLERAKVCAREPLGSIPPDSQVRKRNRDTLQKHGDDPFRKELRSVVESGVTIGVVICKIIGAAYRL